MRSFNALLTIFVGASAALFVDFVHGDSATAAALPSSLQLSLDLAPSHSASFPVLRLTLRNTDKSQRARVINISETVSHTQFDSYQITHHSDSNAADAAKFRGPLISASTVSDGLPEQRELNLFRAVAPHVTSLSSAKAMYVDVTPADHWDFTQPGHYKISMTVEVRVLSATNTAHVYLVLPTCCPCTYLSLS